MAFHETTVGRCGPRVLGTGGAHGAASPGRLRPTSPLPLASALPCRPLGATVASLFPACVRPLELPQGRCRPRPRSALWAWARAGLPVRSHGAGGGGVAGEDDAGPPARCGRPRQPGPPAGGAARPRERRGRGRGRGLWCGGGPAPLETAPLPTTAGNAPLWSLVLLIRWLTTGILRFCTAFASFLCQYWLTAVIFTKKKSVVFYSFSNRFSSGKARSANCLLSALVCLFAGQALVSRDTPEPG